MAHVGFVGAGQLGMPMVERLLTAGHTVVVHARRTEVRAALAALGAQVVDTAREAADADLVILCLFSDEQLVAACTGPDGVVAGLREDTVLASHVTGTRATLASLDAVVVDAPVSGTADDIRAGRLTVLLGGPPEAVSLCADVMAAYAGTVLHVGGPGDALAVKLVNNLLFAAHSQLAVAAVELGAAFGVSREPLLAAVQSCSGASSALATLATLADEETFASLAGPFLRKDVSACSDELTSSGSTAPLLLQTVRLGPLDLTA
ncbi:MAG: 6-phosphogluconate dehydrogenase, NAD-binding protein [Frankiales bacterium]|nr:6-phosphogluconate dehydrogenase, NAD-binding protein [Frankiales bacterium]